MELGYLQAEHMALLELCQQVTSPATQRSGAEVGELIALRSKLNRILIRHLAKEDKHVYPALRASGNGRIATLASQYHAETGHLGDLWADLMKAWPDCRIFQEPEAFRAALRPALEALVDRIQREEQMLYPAYLESQGLSGIGIAPDQASAA
ncbi:DUF438 domain-containing protein [Sphingobium sp. B1D7B]|uniref:hemerythrin domain-containing protein n=1 Tax=Sphingobium TaxID=165695 RepID=UPI0022247D85|nr:MULTISPECIES: hemerythrin domain-containing protein [Sphingobium]MCW2391102.1 DUF438 domain-containing protein [Sphingobium sp. B11D3A]MCW2406311.1 DUF438 domain-containing protein [Sphingobium sp. B1D7B]